jgi:uncharacterized protein YndB with AHSA1/START domain
MSARTTMTWTTSIARPPDIVFAYLADVTKHGEWSPKPYRVEGASGLVTTGDTFTSIGTMPYEKNHRNDVTVTECSPPSRLRLDAEEKGEHFINTFELRAEGGSTVLTRTMDVPKPGGLAGAAFPIIKALFIKPDVQKGLDKLKVILERT